MHRYILHKEQGSDFRSLVFDSAENIQIRIDIF